MVVRLSYCITMYKNSFVFSFVASFNLAFESPHYQSSQYNFTQPFLSLDNYLTY